MSLFGSYKEDGEPIVIDSFVDDSTYVPHVFSSWTDREFTLHWIVLEARPMAKKDAWVEVAKPTNYHSYTRGIPKEPCPSCKNTTFTIYYRSAKYGDVKKCEACSKCWEEQYE